MRSALPPFVEVEKALRDERLRAKTEGADAQGADAQGTAARRRYAGAALPLREPRAREVGEGSTRRAWLSLLRCSGCSATKERCRGTRPPPLSRRAR